MPAGKYRHRVRIEGPPVDARGLDGAVIQTWPTVAIVHAEVRDLSGREFYAARQTQAEVTTNVRIRYRSGVTTDHRIVYGTRTLRIEAVADEEGRRRELVLRCTEVT